MGQFIKGSLSLSKKNNNTILLVSPITADSTFCELIGVHLSLMLGFWSLGKSNNEGN